MIKIKKNKKVIVFGLIIVIVVGIIYYICTNDIKSIISDEDILINTEENNKKLNTIENSENKDSKNMIMVHVSGAVQNEGVIEIEEESRIINAIEKTGGLKENACMNDINLASIVEDGEKIYIPTQEEYNNMKDSNKAENDQKEAIIIKNSENKSNINKNNKININTATQSELETLPGIGSITALKIVTYRNENGKFKMIEDIKKVKGIGESKFKEIKDLIVIK